MVRPRRFEHLGDARFVTFSCVGRLPLLGTAAIRDAFVERLGRARELRGFELYAWVVMPEHVHLLLRPGAGDTLAGVLQVIKQPFAKRVVARWREIGAPVLERMRRGDGRIVFWQRGGGYDRNVRDGDEFRKKIAYIHANPVRRGLVEREVDWEWSSARQYVGMEDRLKVEVDRVAV